VVGVKVTGVGDKDEVNKEGVEVNEEEEGGRFG